MSASAPGARGGALLPSAQAPTIDSAREAKLAELDALLAIVPLPAGAAAFRHLPESERWRELDARGGARGGSVRTTVLSNRRQTLAVLGYLPSEASAFERLTLAGRMLKEAGARSPETLGLVASGSAAAGNPRPGAGIAHLRYRAARRRRSAAPDIALIGKGILFDTGGVNLKTHRSMLDMHTDMAGSAVALATLIALAELRAPLAADAWLAITENRIGPDAYRPQEVVRAANGVTIQVIHTDAEGRMVLADTLALAARTEPRLMIDFATLTGACVHSLTERMSGVFANRPELAGKLCEAGRVSGERVWSFPFEPDYDAELESKVADVMQCAIDGKGDHILATRFLARFVPPSVPWAHVDLSSATRSGGLAHVNTDVTGFGVRFALELILGQQVLDRLERAA